jgi:hypothetical protein
MLSSSARKDRDGWIPAALSLEDIQYHFRVGRTKWSEWVARGVMPQPRVMDGIVLWDRHECETAFREFPHRGEKPKVSLADQVRR